MKTPKLSPTIFVDLCNNALEMNFSPLILVGEVANLKIVKDKFVFFDVKDNNTKVACFMMKYAMPNGLSDGIVVEVLGAPKMSDVGKFSVVCRDVLFVKRGDIKKQYDETKLRLKKEGLFELKNKKPLPKNPKKIGVISSAQASGFFDFMEIINSRQRDLKITVKDCNVQGVSAVSDILNALEYFEKSPEKPEVLAIVRGGGDSDDLAVFNNERLVRKVFAMQIPTIVGIGHQNDEVLLDFVADKTALTPTHAGQIIVPDLVIESKILSQKAQQVKVLLLQKIVNKKQKNKNNLEYFVSKMEDEIVNKKQNLIMKKRNIEAYNPYQVLKKGYAIVRGEVDVGNEVKIENHKIIITAEVKNVRKK